MMECYSRDCSALEQAFPLIPQQGEYIRRILDFS